MGKRLARMFRIPGSRMHNVAAELKETRPELDDRWKPADVEKMLIDAKFKGTVL